MYRFTARRYCAFGLLLFCAGLGSCGGREAHPVSATTPYDDQLTCDHLRAERKANDQKIDDLTGERHEEAATNVGMVLAGGLGGVLMMDTSNAEATEIDALGARNKVLDDLIAKKCAAAGAAAPVPAVANAASASHDVSQFTAAAPDSSAKSSAPVAVQAPLTVASTETPKTASAPQSKAAASPTLAAAESTPQPARGTWTAKLHWIPSPPPSPKFGSSGESILAYDVALTNVSFDADKLNISSEQSNITGRVIGRTIELDGWYKDPWGSVNSIRGSLTENGDQFTGQETCYNTQLAGSAPTSQMTRHFCNVELSRIQ